MKASFYCILFHPSILTHPSGTSSILAGAALAAVYRCMGRTVDTHSLIHAVLHLEQTLTTGKSWSFNGNERFYS